MGLETVLPKPHLLWEEHDNLGCGNSMWQSHTYPVNPYRRNNYPSKEKQYTDFLTA